MNIFGPIISVLTIKVSTQVSLYDKAHLGSYVNKCVNHAGVLIFINRFHCIAVYLAIYLLTEATQLPLVVTNWTSLSLGENRSLAACLDNDNSCICTVVNPYRVCNHSN